MIKIKHPVFASPEQMMFIIEGMRNPKASWHLSDSYIDYDKEYLKDKNVEIWYPKFHMGEKDFNLMKNLAAAGKDHRKTLRMMPVFLRITTNHTVWAEIDTYKVGTVRNSCSKMHTIHKSEFTEDMFSNEGMKEIADYVVNINLDGWIDEWSNDDNSDEETYLSTRLQDNQRETISLLNDLRDKFNNTKDKSKRKKYWRTIIDILPIGFNLTANMSLNYEVLLNIYFSRKHHKMVEWREFCQWMLDNVPYFRELVDYLEGDKKVSKGIRFSYVDKEEKVKSLKEFFSAEGFEVSDEELAAMEVGLPKRATKGSAGYDCYSPIGFCLEPGQEIKLPTLLKAYMPQDVFLGVYPRSGLGFKYYARLANTVGIIDSDYVDNESNEGHIFVKIRNEGDKPMSINPGDGICQFIFQKYFTTEDDEAEGTREGGFGSTDK